MKLLRKVFVNVPSISELKKALSGIDYRGYFVTVVPQNVETARWVAHDTRIDSILMTIENIRVFDRKQVGVMKYYAKPLEIHIPELLLTNHREQEVVYRRINLFLRSRVAVVVGSVAEKWSNLYPPIAITKILSTMYDIPEKVALLAISDIPRKILVSKGVIV